MSALDLLLSRKALAAGVGKTTRLNKVLPALDVLTPIPARIGRDKPGTPVPDVCLAGDLYAPPWPNENWRPTWYVDAVKLLSTDGLWSIDKSTWKRWTGRAGQSGDTYVQATGSLVHLNFSSPTTAAVLESTAGGTDQQFTEVPWSERTWWGVRSASFMQAGLTGIVQRLRTMTFRATGTLFPAGGQLLTWSFSDDSSATTTVTATPACINKSGDEKGLATRVMQTYGAPHIQKLSLAIDGKKAIIKTETPWGFCPTFKDSAINAYTGTLPAWYNNPRVNDLSKVNLIGQAWHGLGNASGLLNAGYALRTLPGYQSPPTCNTRYFKKPGLPTPPDPSTPDTYPAAFVSAGDRYYNDVVLFGGRRYSPSVALSNVELNDSQWLHVDDAGVVRVLSAIMTNRTPSTSRFTIYNHGPLVLGQSIGSPVALRTVDITTTSPEAVAQYSSLVDGIKVAFETGSADVQGFSTYYYENYRNKRKNNYVLSTTHPVPASPNGRQIALFRGVWYKNVGTEQKYRQYTDNIHTVATVDIASNLAVSDPVVVFQWQAHIPTDRVTTFSYVYYDATHDMEMASTTMTPYTEILCVMVAYGSNGRLNVVTEESSVAAADGTKALSPRTRPYTPRSPMSYPSEIATDINMRRDIITVKGFGDDGTGSITGGVGLLGTRSLCARLSNNVIYFLNINDGSNLTWSDHFIAPSGVVARSTVFAGAIVSNESRYLSWNPRTGALGGVETAYVSGESFSNYISWV